MCKCFMGGGESVYWYRTWRATVQKRQRALYLTGNGLRRFVQRIEPEICHKEAPLGRVCSTVRCGWQTTLQIYTICFNFNKFHKIHKVTMHFDHIPGKNVEVNWAGQIISIQDVFTGEIHSAYLKRYRSLYDRYLFLSVSHESTSMKLHRLRFWKNSTHDRISQCCLI